MNKQLSITEYFARMCATGLMPDVKEITAIYLQISDDYFWIIAGGNSWVDMKTYYSISSDLIDKDNNKKITLRKDGINLYELEWEGYKEDDDIEQEYWVLQSGMVGLSQIDCVDEDGIITTKMWGKGNPVLKKLHGRITPTEADFIKVYGE